MVSNHRGPTFSAIWPTLLRVLLGHQTFLATPADALQQQAIYSSWRYDVTFAGVRPTTCVFRARIFCNPGVMTSSMEISPPLAVSCSTHTIEFLYVRTRKPITQLLSNFYRASSYASAVLAVVILSVCLSVCHKRALWQKPNSSLRIFWQPHERAITLVFWYQQWLVGDAPSVWNLHSKWPTPFETRRLWQIYAYNVSTVRDSDKVQLGLWQIGSRPRAFQRAIDGVHTLPLSLPKGGSKSIFCF